jgi:hypothetical protein
MKKVIMGAVLGILLLTLVWASIDYSSPDSVAQAPPDKIDVTQALANGNGNAITQAQWLYGDNLDKADDLALYPEAQRALEQKHGLSVDLSSGQTTYNHGKITNGDVTLDLTLPQYNGAVIKALKEGGFSISKGSSEGKFEYDGNKIDFGGSTGDVDVKPNGEIILSKGAMMTDKIGNEITAIQEGLMIKKEGSTTTIIGIGKVETTYGKGYVGVSDYNGELTLAPNYQISGKNYVWDAKKGDYNSEGLKMDKSEPDLLDAKMHDTLIEIAGGENVVALMRTEALVSTFSKDFPPDVAQKLALKIHGESPSFTEINGNRGLLVMEKTASGESKLTAYNSGKTSDPIEGTSEGGGSLAVQSEDDNVLYFNTKVTSDTRIIIPYIGGEVTVEGSLFELADFKVPGIKYTKESDGWIAASVEFDTTSQNMMIKINLLKKLVGG